MDLLFFELGVLRLIQGRGLLSRGIEIEAFDPSSTLWKVRQLIISDLRARSEVLALHLAPGGEPDDLGDFLQGGREGDFGSTEGLRGVALELTAKQKAAALEQEFDLLKIVQAADDLGPFGLKALLLHADFELALENQRQEAAEDVTADGSPPIDEAY